MFDLLKKPDLGRADVACIKTVATELLGRLKMGKLRVDQWREKEATRSAAQIAIHDFLCSDETGLPEAVYSETDVTARSRGRVRARVSRLPDGAVAVLRRSGSLNAAGKLQRLDGGGHRKLRS